MTLFLRLIVGAALASLATTAVAQSDAFSIPGTSPMDHLPIQNALTSSVIDHNVLDNVIRNQGGAGGPKRRYPYIGPSRPSAPRNLFGGAVAGAPVSRRIAYPFTATAAVRESVTQAFVARLQAQNPSTAAAFGAQLRRNDVDSIYAGITRPFGLAPDDAGDVMTAYLVLGYLVANGAPDPSRAAVGAARAQVGALLASGGPVADPARRARVAEEIKILFVTLHAGWQGARREGSVRGYADGIARMFAEQAGQPLRTIALTDRGFVPR